VKSKVIVALDQISKKDALNLATALKGHVWGFKVNDLLIAEGTAIIENLKAFGNVFADSKLHDIPNTVANSVKRLSDSGADLITVHASGGIKMLEAAATNSSSSKILAVTALTSLSETDTKTVYGKQPSDLVIAFAKLAHSAGVPGIVCSPLELELLNSNAELKQLLKVTPGIRPSSYDKADDQTRVATPLGAINAGADLLVIGRPITQFKDSPQQAIDLLNSELS